MANANSMILIAVVTLGIALLSFSQTLQHAQAIVLNTKTKRMYSAMTKEEMAEEDKRFFQDQIYRNKNSNRHYGVHGTALLKAVAKKKWQHNLDELIQASNDKIVSLEKAFHKLISRWTLDQVDAVLVDRSEDTQTSKFLETFFIKDENPNQQKYDLIKSTITRLFFDYDMADLEKYNMQYQLANSNDLKTAIVYPFEQNQFYKERQSHRYDAWYTKKSELHQDANLMSLMVSGQSNEFDMALQKVSESQFFKWKFGIRSCNDQQQQEIDTLYSWIEGSQEYNQAKDSSGYIFIYKLFENKIRYIEEDKYLGLGRYLEKLWINSTQHDTERGGFMSTPKLYKVFKKILRDTKENMASLAFNAYKNSWEKTKSDLSTLGHENLQKAYQVLQEFQSVKELLQLSIQEYNKHAIGNQHTFDVFEWFAKTKEDLIKDFQVRAKQLYTEQQQELQREIEVIPNQQ